MRYVVKEAFNIGVNDNLISLLMKVKDFLYRLMCITIWPETKRKVGKQRVKGGLYE